MMGGIPPEQAGRLTLWQYQAMRWNWNDRHKVETDDGDDGEPVEPPSEEFVRQRQAELYELGVAGKAGS